MRASYILRKLVQLVLATFILWIFTMTIQWNVPYGMLMTEKPPQILHTVLVQRIQQNNTIDSSSQILKRVVENDKFYTKYNASVWPSKLTVEPRDRIEAQLAYVPNDYNSQSPFKLIVDMDRSSVLSARKRIIEENCPVQRCNFSSNAEDILKADAVIVRSISPRFDGYLRMRPARQVWVMYQLESPLHSADYVRYSSVVNWTATYRRDSVIVTPYEKFVTFANTSQLPASNPSRNYAANKTKLVAWFVSNCNAKNGRDKYVSELRQYINVDIYGYCGELSCSRSTGDRCFKLLQKEYKFYLSFENSNCKDYITEKLYWNAYLNDVVPVVMGAHPDDYAAVAPPHSYIHVDDFASPRELADYLHKLDADPALYNSYFRWKGTGHFVNTKFWCRLCAMVHDAAAHPFQYSNINQWWRGPSVCTKPSQNPASGGRWSSWRATANSTQTFADLLP